MIHKIENQNHKFNGVNIKSALDEFEDWEWEKNKICLCCGDYTENLHLHIRLQHGTVEDYLNYFELPKDLLVAYKPIDHNLYGDLEAYLDTQSLEETDDEDAYMYVQLPNKQIKVKHKLR